MPNRRWRQHLRSDGRPKAMLTRERAEVCIQEMAEDGRPAEMYVCSYCRTYHVGSWHGPAPEPWWGEYLRIELGQRAFACLLMENRGKTALRIKSIRQRGNAAAKLRVGVKQPRSKYPKPTIFLPAKAPPLEGLERAMRT